MGAPYLLSVSEVAAILRRDRSTVHRQIRSGAFPLEVIDTMGVKQIRRTDLEAFLHLEPGTLAVAS